VKLTLGCGAKVLSAADGWLNHDRTRRPGIDLAFDLARFPWPVKRLRGAVEEILAEDVLEHLPKELMVRVMDECWGLLIPDGMMDIQLPMFGTFNHLADLTHCWGGSVETFDLLDPDTVVGGKNPWYTDRRWKILEKRQDAPGQGFNCHFRLQKRMT
jgi:hypothetical protein